MPQGAILTNVGLSKISSATPLDQLNVVQVAVGDGNGGYPALTPDMTGLVNEVWRGTASNPIRDPNNANVLIFEAAIPATAGPFTIREQAIFDDAGDMIAIGQTSVVEKPDPNEAVGVVATMRLHVALSNAEQVDLFYTDTAATHHNSLTNRDDAGSHPASAIAGVGEMRDEIVGGEIFPPEPEKLTQVGSVVTTGSTHLRVMVSGEPAIVAMSPVASGIVSNLTEKNATVGGVDVDFSRPILFNFKSVGAMLSGKTFIGGRYCTGGTTWEKISDTNNNLSDFKALTPASIRDWGVNRIGLVDTSYAWIEAVNHADEVYGNSEDTYLFSGNVPVPNYTKVRVKGQVLWNGVAPPFINAGRDRGIFEARGVVTNTIDSITLTGIWKEGAERFPTNDVTLFDEVDYCTINAGSLPEASIGYLCKPSSQNGVTNRVSLDYSLGWDLENPTFTYRKVVPAIGVEIEGFEYEDLTSGQTDDQDISGVSFVYAVNCHTRNVRGKNGTNPTVFTYYTSDCTTQSCQCVDPQKTSGGKGYTVQWNNALRAYSQKMSGKKNRHVVDHTMAAYCIVEDSQGQNTQSGDFLTHGSYEHDITYDNIRGTMHLAASASDSFDFGRSAKNITVDNFVGDVLRCRTNVQNFTGRNIRTSYGVFNSVGLDLENVKLYDSPSNAGRIQINNWSRQIGKAFPSSYTAVVKNSQLKSDPASQVFLFESNLDDDEILICEKSRVDISIADLKGGNIKMRDTYIDGENIVDADQFQSLELIDCEGHEFGLRTSNRAAGINLTIRGGKYCCTNTSNQFFSNVDVGVQNGKVIIDQVDFSEWTGTDVFYTDDDVGKHNPNIKVFMRNNNITQGKVNLTKQTKIIFTGNDTEGATIFLGAANSRRIIANNTML